MTDQLKRDLISYTSRLMLTMHLHEIAAHDTDYEVRYGLVLEAMAVASRAGYATGIAIDPKEPDWPVVYIELPTGQVSWHMPAHNVPWDGHTTGDKYNRIRDFIEQVDTERVPGSGEIGP